MYSEKNMTFSTYCDCVINSQKMLDDLVETAAKFIFAEIKTHGGYKNMERSNGRLSNLQKSQMPSKHGQVAYQIVQNDERRILVAICNYCDYTVGDKT